MTVAERTNRTKFRDQVIQPLMDQGLLEMTHPESPRSPQQKYRLTAQGQAWRANQTEKKK
jgi:ATP-dependent DNA helicase RecG